MSRTTSFSVDCAGCGERITLPLPNSGDRKIDDMMVKWARNGTMHDACAEKHWAGVKQKEAAERLTSRMATWESLCDPMFLTSEEWLQSNPPGLNLSKMAKAQKWKFDQGTEVRKGLLLFGEKTGTGKTTAAWLVLKKEHALGRRIVALTHTELAREALLQFGREDAERRRWIDALLKSDILFLDDVGKSAMVTADGRGKQAEELLFDVLDARMRAGRPCILTTNLRGEALAKAASPGRAEPLLRRLREANESICFDLNTQTQTKEKTK